MADVNTSFAAKDENVAKTIDGLQNRFKSFEGGIAGFSGKVGAMAGSFARAVGPLAALAAGFVGARSSIASFGDAIRSAGELNDLAARTGETAGELAVLQRAFQNAGSSAEAVGPMLNRLQRFMVEGAEGGKAQVAAMGKLGLSFDQLKGKSPSEQMRLLAEKISSISDPAERTALAMEIFGRSGGELMPLLRSMGVEIQNAREQLGGYPAAVTQSAAALDAIGDNFVAISAKAKEFITGALVNIAPELEKITERIAKIDFASMGMRLGEAMQRAYDFFRGLFSEPSQIFSLYGDYLEATMRSAGDALIDGFQYAFNFFVNTWTAMIENDVFGKFAQLLADTFMYGVANLNMALLGMIEGVLAFWGQLWGSVTQGGISGFSEKLYNVVKFFASDFFKALTDPIGFVAGKLTSALLGSANETGKAFQFSWDSATGSFIEKTRAGLQGVVDSSGTKLRESASAFGQSLSQSTTEAVQNTDLVRNNFFGSAEAVRELQSGIADVEAKGQSIRESSEAAALAQSRVPTYAESMLAAYEAAGLKAEHLREQVGAAKGDIQIAADLTTGPRGIATATEEAAKRTTEASGSMTRAFDSVSSSGQKVGVDLGKAGNDFYKVAVDAGRTFKQEVIGALGHLSGSFKGMATEATLRQAVEELRAIKNTMNRPVLV